MKKIVINDDYGGFGLSAEAMARYKELSGLADTVKLYDFDLDRDDPLLVQVVEELGGHDAGGPFASLKIVEIPGDVKWYVSDYDGVETVRESHRSWS